MRLPIQLEADTQKYFVLKSSASQGTPLAPVTATGTAGEGAALDTDIKIRTSITANSSVQSDSGHHRYDSSGCINGHQ